MQLVAAGGIIPIAALADPFPALSGVLPMTAAVDGMQALLAGGDPARIVAAAGALALLGGVTVALGLGLWRAEYGVLALPYVLALGGASAGLRFAWLDREAGRDG